MNNKYKNPQGRRCDCGKPAVRWKNTGFVCAACDRIETLMYGTGSGSKTQGFDFAMNMTYNRETKYITTYKVNI